MDGVKIMKYYKDTNDEVYAFEADGSQDSFIPDTLVPMTQTEVDLHLNPPTTKADKLSELEGLFSEALIGLTAGYSEAEQKTWNTQYQQAKSFMLDSTSSTPALDALVVAKGSTKDVVAPVILAKAEALEIASLGLTGKYQALVDSVNALPATATQADFDAIVWQ